VKLEDYIRIDEYGERFVAGHRVPIQSVLWAHIEQGMDGRQLADRFHTLSLEKIYAMLAYYYKNKDEVDAYLRETEEELRRQREEFTKNYKGPTNEELRARLRAKQEQEALAAGGRR